MRERWRDLPVLYLSGYSEEQRSESSEPPPRGVFLRKPFGSQQLLGRLRELLDEAVLVDDAPTVVRFPKGAPPADIEAVDRVGGCDVLVRSGAKDVLVVAVGSMATTAVEVAARLVAQGIGVTVVDPRWVLPVPRELLTLAADHQLVVTVSDCGTHGGFGSALSDALRAAELDVRQRDLATGRFPLTLLGAHKASRGDQLLAAWGISVQPGQGPR